MLTSGSIGHQRLGLASTLHRFPNLSSDNFSFEWLAIHFNAATFVSRLDSECRASSRRWRTRWTRTSTAPSVGQTWQGSFSAVSKQNFARTYALESSRRELHNAFLCIDLNVLFCKLFSIVSHWFSFLKNGKFHEILRIGYGAKECIV